MTHTYDLGNGSLLRFFPQAIEVFARFRQGHGKHESGGILLGRDFPGTELVVEVASAPSKWDRSGPSWFDRSRKAAQKIVDAAWESSQGERIYLGEWHSHPEDFPSPSGRDSAMIRNMLKDTKMETDFLLLVIIGRQENWVGVQNADGLRRLPNKVEALHPCGKLLG